MRPPKRAGWWRSYPRNAVSTATPLGIFGVALIGAAQLIPLGVPAVVWRGLGSLLLVSSIAVLCGAQTWWGARGVALIVQPWIVAHRLLSVILASSVASAAAAAGTEIAVQHPWTAEKDMVAQVPSDCLVPRNLVLFAELVTGAPPENLPSESRDILAKRVAEQGYSCVEYDNAIRASAARVLGNTLRDYPEQCWSAAEASIEMNPAKDEALLAITFPPEVRAAYGCENVRNIRLELDVVPDGQGGQLLLIKDIQSGG